MGIAAPGETLVTGNVHRMLATGFTFEPRPPLAVKGKAEPLPIFAVTGTRQVRGVRLQEPSYSLPMVGRQAEFELLRSRL